MYQRPPRTSVSGDIVLNQSMCVAKKHHLGMLWRFVVSKLDLTIPNEARSMWRIPLEIQWRAVSCPAQSGTFTGAVRGPRTETYQPIRFRFKFTANLVLNLRWAVVFWVFFVAACRPSEPAPHLGERQPQPAGGQAEAAPSPPASTEPFPGRSAAEHPTDVMSGETVPVLRDPTKPIAVGNKGIGEPKTQETASNSTCGKDTDTDRARIAKEMAAADQINLERELGKQRAEQAKRQLGKIQDLVKKMDECAAKTKHFDPMCQAMAEAKEDPCHVLSDTDEKLGCRSLAAVAMARRAQDSKPCSKVADNGMRALCVGVATGKFVCPKQSSSPFAAACSLVMNAGNSADCPFSGDERPMVCDAFYVTLAVTHLDPTLCERVELERTRKACKAFLNNDSTLCATDVSPGPECRDVVLGAEKLQPSTGTDSQTGIRLWVVNLFEDVADCDAHIEVRQAGKVVGSKTIDIGKLTVVGQVAEITTSISAPPGDLAINAVGKCLWIPSVKAK